MHMYGTTKGRRYNGLWGKDDIASKSDRVAGESVDGTKRRQLTWGGGGGVRGDVGRRRGRAPGRHGEDDDVDEDKSEGGENRGPGG